MGGFPGAFQKAFEQYKGPDGDRGPADRRIGKVSPWWAPDRELEQMHEAYGERFRHFAARRFHKQLVRRDG